MVELHFKSRHVVIAPLISVLATVVFAGCGDDNGGHLVHAKGRAGALDDGDTVMSAHDYLEVGDFVEFQPDRPKGDVLESVKWRGGLVAACLHEGRSICVVQYGVVFHFDREPNERELPINAIFIDRQFARFVLADNELSDEDRMPVKVGDCKWIIKQLKREPVTIAEIKEQGKLLTPPPTHTDIGLTMVALMLGPGLPAPSRADYERNAALRDQFNAARLDIGMTETEVRGVFNAKPLESGVVGDGRYSIYGSDETVEGGRRPF
jgi:hypothetical protein